MKQDSENIANISDLENLKRFLPLLSERSREKVFWVLNNRRVTKYVFKPSGRELWVVSGEGGDYLVLGDYYCACLDFYLESLVRIRRTYCYHIIAKKIAELIGSYRTYEVPDSEFENLVNDLMRHALDLSK